MYMYSRCSSMPNYSHYRGMICCGGSGCGSSHISCGGGCGSSYPSCGGSVHRGC